MLKGMGSGVGNSADLEKSKALWIYDKGALSRNGAPTSSCQAVPNITPSSIDLKSAPYASKIFAPDKECMPCHKNFIKHAFCNCHIRDDAGDMREEEIRSN